MGYSEGFPKSTRLTAEREGSFAMSEAAAIARATNGARSRYFWGLCSLLSVVVLWVSSSFLMNVSRFKQRAAAEPAPRGCVPPCADDSLDPAHSPCSLL